MEKRLKEQKYLIDLLKAAINGGQAAACPNDIDFDHLTKYAEEHGVEGTAYMGLLNSEGVPEAVLDVFAEKYKKGIVREYLQHSEGVRIFSQLEKNGVDFIMLKGWIMKKLYPQPAMRSMCDIDILIKKKDSETVKGIMDALGYTSVKYGTNPDIYLKAPIMNIEVHNALIRDKTDHFDTTWERVLPVKGFSHSYAMTNEDFYIFMIAHLWKHFVGSGTGIRSILDIYVYLKHYKDSLDNEYINKKLTDSGIADFDGAVRELCMYWFGDGELTERAAELEPEILESAVYGNKETAARNYIKSTISNESGKVTAVNKFLYILKLMFPGLSVMEKSYPWLRKVPFLIPFMWIVRGVKSAFSRSGTVKKDISNVVNADKNAKRKK
ncbi:MAG: nucleotidyltransferase family protein [Clostridiales bacterium]|nr:nucleotidyltransferase family protein [Clostridiales bacterium]